MSIELIKNYCKEEGYHSFFLNNKDFKHLAGSVYLGGKLSFIIWNKDYVSRLSELHKRNPLLANKFVRFTVLHEKGHKNAPYDYEPQAELAAVSRYEEPLEGVIIGLALRLHFDEELIKNEESKKDAMSKTLCEYCPWLRENLQSIVINRAIELIEK